MAQLDILEDLFQEESFSSSMLKLGHSKMKN